MTARWRGAALGAATVASLALFFGACGDDDDDGGGPPGGVATEESVIAPFGFRIEIQSFDLPADAVATPPSVTFRVTEGEGAGTPVEDLLQRIQNRVATPAAFPNVNGPSFTFARLEPEGEYRSYYLNAAQTGAAAVSVPTTGDSRLTSLGNGTYRFTLTPLPANPTAEERARTHTVGVYAANIPPPPAGTTGAAADQAASATFNFVPAGGTPQLHQVVAANGCNRCHAPAVRAHGRRLGVQLCLTCHTPQTRDPDTGNSVEFAEMIHKIHYGGDRALGAADVNDTIAGLPRPPNFPAASTIWPPAAAGEPQPYTIVGNQGNTFVFDAGFINDVRNCTLCHQGEDADRHLTFATQQSCTTCHSNVKFDGSAAGFCDTQRRDGGDCNHPSLIPQGTSCSACHSPDLVRSSHVTRFALAERFRYEIVDVTVDDARIPTVRFRVLDTANNQPRNLATDPAYTRPASSLSVRFSWPTQEYTNVGSGVTTSPGQPVSVAGITGGARTAALQDVAGQPNTYALTSTVPIPAGVTSASVHLEGHPVLQGENVPVVNAIQAFGVGGAAATPRRQVVAVESCNRCHGVVSAHGENRNGSVDTCVVCHNPKATDFGRRGTGSAGFGLPEAPIDFKRMIHQIHAADIKRNEITIFGFGNTPHTFPGEIPHGVGNCNLCHVNQSWRLPLAEEVLDTVVDTNGTPANQADDVTAGAMRMVCTACHDNVRFTQAIAPAPAFPVCNTLAQVNAAECFHSAGNVADSACAACHGTGQSDDVAQKHPIR